MNLSRGQENPKSVGTTKMLGAKNDTILKEE